MGNCCSSFPEEQLPRPPPGRRGYPVGNTRKLVQDLLVSCSLDTNIVSRKRLPYKSCIGIT